MEDLPNLLQRDYGLKPQGKAAPMSAHRTGAGNSTGSGGHLSGYDDVFGGPPKFTAPSFASHTEEGYDDIFRSFPASIKSSSVPVFDAPVYDDDIFGGIKGVRSSAVTYDDVFSGGSGGPNAASFEDLLGEFGGSGKPSPGLNSQQSANRGGSGFEDLIPGFGSGEPAKKNRSAAETKSRQRVTSVLSAGSPRKAAEDPFLVIEPKPLLSNPSSAFVPDPLEQLKVSSKSGSSKERKASSNGATQIDGINAFDGFPLAGPAVSSAMSKSRMANSPLKANQSSSPTHKGGNKELAEGKSARKSLLSSHPVKDYTKPYTGVHTADMRKSGGHSNTTRKFPSPRRHRQPLHENSTNVSNLNSQESLPVMKSEKGANFTNEVLVTVAEIKLLTQPTALPPPSRPPPPLVIKQGPSSKKRLDSKADGNSYGAGNSDGFAASLQNSQPHRYGKSSGNPTINELEDFVSGGSRVRNEVAMEFLSPSMDKEQLESSSAAAASAAAMKEAMERAEARLKLAKEARERKREDTEREVKTGKSKEKERQEKKDARTTQGVWEPEEKEREVKAAREAREREEQEREELEKERRQREREREKEREREREREREKDRLAVERANQEARERAAAEARERAERVAVERATAEARERAAAEARERAERAATEAREKAAAEARERAAAEARERAEKAAVERAAAEARERAAAEARERAAAEARLRAERAAVERANSEARERAAERAALEKAASEAKERAERAAAAARERQRRNENDLESFFGVGVRPNSAPRQRPPTSDATSDAHSQNRGFSGDGFQKVPTGAAPGFRQSNLATNMADDWTSLFTVSSSEEFQEVEGESAERRRARLERHQRTLERAAKALAEKNDRDLQAQREQAERHRLAETLDADVKRWATGKEGNLRALLSTLQYVLWPESGWQPVSLMDVITAAAVKKVYRKATLCVHPDKVQQKGATLQQKYIAEKVFDLLKEAWNKFNAEELF